MSSSRKHLKRKLDQTSDANNSSIKRLRTGYGYETYQKDGLVHTLHGTVYQIKLLLLFMKRGVNKRYQFRLASERRDAEKFDDIEFQFLDHAGQSVQRYIQVKHKQVQSEKITDRDLLAGPDAPFSIQKYFISYLKIKQRLKPGEKLQDLIIFTNVDLEDGLKRNCVELKGPDDILDTPELNDQKAKRNAKRFKLDSKSPFAEKLVKVCKNSTELIMLTKELLYCITKNKPLNLKNPIFKKYHVTLARTIMNKEKTFIKLDKDKIPEYLYNHLKEFQRRKIEVSNKFGVAETDASNPSSSKIVNDLPNDTISDVELDGFFDKLVLAVNQPNERELFKVIEQTMRADENINFIDKSIEMKEIYSELIDWMVEKEGRYITYTDCQNMLGIVKQKISKIELIGFKRIICKKIIDSGIKFQEKLTDLQAFLETNKNQYYCLVNSYSSSLSAIKAYQTLIDIPGYKEDDGYIFIELELVNKIPNQVLEAFKSATYSNLLVILFSPSDETIDDEIFLKVSRILRGNANKKIVFIMTKENLLPDVVEWTKFYDNKNIFTDLTKESQQEIWKNTEINFQDQDMHMNVLINESLKSCIKEEFLLQTFNKEKITIGGSLLDSDKVLDYYVERKFNVNEMLFGYIPYNTSEFMSTRIACIDDRNVKPNQDIVLISENETEFDILCAKYNKMRNVHWFVKKKMYSHKYDDDYDCVWQKSHGETISKLREILTSHPHEENYFEIKRKFILLSAPPGTGKSTALTRLANSLKESDPSLWVLRVDLVDLVTKFKEHRHIVKDKITGKFLRELFWIEPNGPSKRIIPLEEALFDNYYEQGKVALFLDGFDEICPTYKNEVIGLLKELKDSQLERLCVTSRPFGVLQELENTLLTFSLEFVELTEEDRLNMMIGIWKNFECNLHDTEANRVAKKLIAHFEKIGIDLNSPLHIKLVATICKDFLDPETNSIEINETDFNLAVLYEKFFQKLFHDIYIEEKNPGWYKDKDRPNTDKLINKEHDSAITLHKHLAFYVLFGEEIFQQLFFEEFKDIPSKIQEIDIGSYKMGIIERIRDNKPIFVHRTFAEYFCALWLVDEDNWSQPDFRAFFRDHVTKQKMIMQFFGHLMIKNKNYAETSPIHFAVLHNDRANLENLLKQIHNTEGDHTFIQKLNANDELMQWTPLQCAAELHYFHLVEVLIKSGADAEMLHKSEISKQILSNSAYHNYLETFKIFEKNRSMTRYRDTFLQKAIEGDALEVVRYIFELCSFQMHTKGFYLHFAAMRNALKVVTYLIDTNQLGVNFANYFGFTSLHFAAFTDALDVVMYLTSQQDVKINATNKYGRTPLHQAVMGDAIETVKYLTEIANVDIIVHDIYGQTPLHLAAGEKTSAIKKTIVTQMYHHLSNHTLYAETNPIHLAIFKNDEGSLENLLSSLNINEAGCTIKLNAKDDLMHWSPLQCAAELEDLKSVEKLLKSGADGRSLCKYLSENCSTKYLIYNVAFNNCLEIFKILEKGYSHFTGYLDYALQKAIEGDALDVVNYIFESNAFQHQMKGFYFQFAARKNALKVIEHLLSTNQININFANGFGFTSLHFAAFADALDVVTYLAGQQDVDVNAANKYNRTPLHQAAMGSSLEAVKNLIKLCDINIQDMNGHTPLHIAARRNVLKIVKYLATQPNVDLYAKDNFGKTILHLAAMGDALKVVKYCIEKQKFDINIQDGDGQTPLDLAISYEAFKVQQYFRGPQTMTESTLNDTDLSE